MSPGDTLRRSILEKVAPVVAVSEQVVEGCVRHFELILKWSARLNLTSVLDPAEAAVRHYGQSLFLAAHLTSGLVVDIGSGGGFPGIPTAILRPECTVTLVESDQRKAVFLREATRGMSNVRVRSVRAQDVEPRFDWMTSRAVSTKELLKLNVADRIALLLASAAANGVELWSTPLPWGGGVLASRTPLSRII